MSKWSISSWSWVKSMEYQH